MTIIPKDILTVERGVIAHQVNCRGRMGAGLAKAIRKTWPIVYVLYRDEISYYGLGDCQVIPIHKGLYVANLFGQIDFGNTGVFTDYGALTKALSLAVEFAEKAGLELFLPFLLGCGLAGGDWKIVSKIIDDFAPRAYVCKRPEPAR